MSEDQSLEATPTSTTRKDGYDIKNSIMLLDLLVSNLF
jgi:hypothetical protein